MTHRSEWAFYLAGALLALAWKWARYCWQGRRLGKTVCQASAEWFFEASQENAVSWATTIAVVWCLAGVYCARDRLSFPSS